MISLNFYKEDMIYYTDSAFWNGSKLVISETILDDYPVQIRRYRAKEVSDKYKFSKINENLYKIGVFSVELYSDKVGCSCPDFENNIQYSSHGKRMPCKHIIAIAALLGDTQAILLKPASQKADPTIIPEKTSSISSQSQSEKTSSTSSQSEKKWRHKIRPQDVRVGKYFMLSDFLYSCKAVTKGVPNIPPTFDGDEVEAFKGLCSAILDPVVEKFGAVSITFGYISDELHQALYGRYRKGIHNCFPVALKKAKIAAAADIVIHSMTDLTKDEPRIVLNWIRDNCVYDRLILYPGSTIICTGWADKPRYDCKEWIYPEIGKALYIDARRSILDKNPIINTKTGLYDLELYNQKPDDLEEPDTIQGTLFDL